MSSLTAILVQRFLLNLQTANRQALGMDYSQDVAHVSQLSVAFRGVVVSLGASLSADDYFVVGQGQTERDSTDLSDEDGGRRSDGDATLQGTEHGEIVETPRMLERVTEKVVESAGLV